MTDVHGVHSVGTHRLALRQLRRAGLPAFDELPSDFRAFLDRVSSSYRDADETRERLTRSLQISSDEMRVLQERLEEKVALRTQELLGAKVTAEKAVQTQSDFLSNMSHELRTPLHAILSFAAFGRRRTNQVSREKLGDYFTQIEQGGLTLLALLNELLDLAKFEAGQMSMCLEPVSMRTLLGGLERQLEAPLAERHLSLELSLPVADLWVRADSGRLGQVVRNLVNNAVKFSPEGGSIRVDLEAKATNCWVSVTDQGPGIPDGELQQVFEKFVQSTATQTGAGGTGLGLALCREILEAHSGKIWARNRSSCPGAVFTFCLPQDAGAAPSDRSRG